MSGGNALREINQAGQPCVIVRRLPSDALAIARLVHSRHCLLRNVRLSLTKDVTLGDRSLTRCATAISVRADRPLSGRYVTPGVCTFLIDAGTSATPRPAAAKLTAIGTVRASSSILGTKPASLYSAMDRSWSPPPRS